MDIALTCGAVDAIIISVLPWTFAADNIAFLQLGSIQRCIHSRPLISSSAQG